jgi:hypothetical protein
MKLPQRHKEILLKEKEEITKKKLLFYPGGFIWINSDHKDVIIENILVTDFTLMYPSIMYMIHDENIYSVDDIDKIKFFIENKENLKLLSHSEYLKYKIEVNHIYGGLTFSGNITSHLISKYLNLFYNELLENNPHNIVYIDTDRIISINSLNMLDCPLTYSTDTLTLGIIKEKKKYIVHDGNELKIKGYPTRKHEEVKREVQSRIRQLQLEKLGITEQLKLF